MARPLKVLFVLRPAAGGIRRHVSSLLERLDRGLFDPILVCPPDEPGVPAVEAAGTPVYRLRIHGELSPADDLETSRAIARLARREGVDLVHAHGIKAGFLCLWAEMARQRTYSLLCTFHNQLPRAGNPLRKRLERWMAGLVAHRMDHLVAISGAIQRDVQTLGIPAEKVSCIYNGFDIAPYAAVQDPSAFRRELGLPESAPLVGTAARLIPQKGIQYLIRAAARIHADYPRAHFLVAGDGPYRPALEAMAAEAGLAGCFHFLGFRRDMPRVLAALDIFVLPTLEEGYALAVLEAMAAGRAVIASDVGGLPELVSAGTGLLVPAGDADRLHAALSELLSDEDRRRSLGLAARERAAGHYSPDEMARRYAEVYQGLAQRRLLRA